MQHRSALGVGLLALAGGALVLVFRSDEDPGVPGSLASSAACRECHAQVYAEWEGSWHARSWTDPHVRELSNDFANEECRGCHAPRPVFQTGLEARVEPRAAELAAGVDCRACHALGGADDGRVAGTRTRDDLPCRPRLVPELSRTESCAPCHDQHQTVTQWLVSRYAAEGVGCIECHMPYRGGDPARGRDHTMAGGHSPELVRAAVELRARRSSEGVVVEVENVGAGHDFPTDERSRAADVFWRPLATPRGPWRPLYRFRSPYRDEVGVESTTLAAHATRRIPLVDADAAGALEVALFYKLTPYWVDGDRPDPEREAVRIERVELAPASGE